MSRACGWSPEQLVAWLIGPARHVAVMVPPSERLPRKLWLPSPVESGELQGLVLQHIEGGILPRRVLRREGGTRLERRGSCLGAYCLHRSPIEGEGWRGRWLCFDVDSPDDHSADKSVAEPLVVARELVQILDDQGLCPVLERSHGGKGWHVWVLLGSWQPAQFVHWLGQQFWNLLAGMGHKVEAFPKQGDLSNGKLGNLVALPFPGEPRALGGGLLVWPDLSYREAASCELVPEYITAEWLRQWQLEQARQRLAAVKRAKRQAYRGIFQPQSEAAGDDDSSAATPGERKPWPAGKRYDYEAFNVPLETVADALGIITRRAGNRLHCDCPRHESRSRESLHIDIDRGWICRCCYSEQSGKGGGIHAWSLVEWCRPNWSKADIAAFLKGLRGGVTCA